MLKNIDTMQEDELFDTIQNIENNISKMRRKGKDTTQFEIEHAYLQKEISIRNARHEAHEKWLQKNYNKQG